MREMKYVIGLDLGSSSTKGMLCDNLGVVHACASRSHAQTTLYAGWQEQDANLTWYDECIDIVSELVQTSQVRPNCIERIGITGCVPAMILINKEGTILRPAILHTDVRAQQELDTIRSYNLDVHHGHLLPKLLWIQQHERDLFDQIHAVLLPHSYVVYKLTGVLSCDYDSATIFGGLFNEQDLLWNQEILNTFDIPSHILVQPQAATAIAGTIMPKSATAFGLSEQTQVIVGSGDSFATLLGSGVCDAHELMFYWGTSGTRVYTENSPIHYLEGPHFS